MAGKVKVPADEKITIEHGPLRVPDGAREVTCSEFGAAVMQSMATL